MDASTRMHMEKTNKHNKESATAVTLIICFLLLLGVDLRALTLNNALSFDEFVQTRAVIEANPQGLDKYTEMNPLTTWTRIFATDILGVHVWSLRLVSLIFSLLTLLGTYLLAKEIYDQKAALFAAAILALSSWHALVSTSISFDGAFLTFYTLLTIYCFMRYEHASLENAAQKNIWLVLCGIAFGLTVLTKYTGVLIFPALLIYSFIAQGGPWSARKDVKEIIVPFLIIGAISLVVFSAFPIAVLFSGDLSYFSVTIHHGDTYFGGRSISIILLAVQYALAALWAGPLLIIGYLLSVIYVMRVRKKRVNGAAKREELLFHIFIIIVLCFYTFIVQDPFRPAERYFTVLLPLLCVIIGNFLARVALTRKEWAMAAAGTFIMLIVDFALNVQPGALLPFYPKSNFINALAEFHWNFFIPFTGDQGPVGLYVHVLVYIIAFAAAAICCAMWLVRKNKMALSIFIAVSLALNVFVMTELALHVTSPDIGRVAEQAAQYIRQESLPGPYYTFRDPALQYSLGQSATNIDFDADPSATKAVLTRGGTLLLIDFPLLDHQGDLWNAFSETCTLKKQWSDKGHVIGYVFSCPKPEAQAR